MKKMKKGLNLLFAVYLITSCSLHEDSELIGEKEKINFAKINLVLSANKKDNKIAYSLLNKYEKHYIWESKLTKLLEQETLYGKSFRLNNSQREVILDLKNKLEVDYFNEEIYDKREWFKNIYYIKILKEAEKVFTKKQIYDIMLSISSNVDNKKGKVQIEQEKEDCNCNRDTLTFCYKSNQTCVNKVDGKKVCKDTSWGCGFLWLSSCTADCVTFWP